MAWVIYSGEYEKKGKMDFCFVDFSGCSVFGGEEGVHMSGDAADDASRCFSNHPHRTGSAYVLDAEPDDSEDWDERDFESTESAFRCEGHWMDEFGQSAGFRNVQGESDGKTARPGDDQGYPERWQNVVLCSYHSGNKTEQHHFDVSKRKNKKAESFGNISTGNLDIFVP